MASTNIKTGPITQFRISEMERILTFLNIWGNKEYLTLANGGYIINMRPMAIGKFVVPWLKELRCSGKEGIKYPIPMPTAMARNIQRVRFLSRKFNFLPVMRMVILVVVCTSSNLKRIVLNSGVPPGLSLSEIGRLCFHDFGRRQVTHSHVGYRLVPTSEVFSVDVR